MIRCDTAQCYVLYTGLLKRVKQGAVGWRRCAPPAKGARACGRGLSRFFNNNFNTNNDNDNNNNNDNNKNDNSNNDDNCFHAAGARGGGRARQPPGIGGLSGPRTTVAFRESDPERNGPSPWEL